MKKLITLLLIVPALVFALIVASCTKEGPQGPKGEDGIDGQDGVATCGQCHNNSQILTAAINQWEHSTHAIGGNFERNEGECAVCHTSQGFLGYNVDGSYDPNAEGAFISNPNPPNCYTCHDIHNTYTSEDLAFTLTDAPTITHTDATYDFGKANLCATCHKGRIVDPFPVAGGDDITVTSSRYGIHYGAQAHTISGLGLFNIGSGYNNHVHSEIENACVTCHMAEPYGAQAGGHTMNISYEYHGATEVNLAGCMDCHSDEEALIENTEELQAEVQALMDQLKELLDAAGITAPGSNSSIPGTYPAEVAGACLNYRAIYYDQSLGVHNPTYIKKLLNNTIAALQ